MNSKTARTLKRLSDSAKGRLFDRLAMDPLTRNQADAELEMAGLLEQYDATDALQIRESLALNGSHEWIAACIR